MSTQTQGTTAAPTGVKMSLKLVVNSKTKTVVFAEAGKDFVDFLFHILSLPLATVVKLLNNEEMGGSLPSLCKSVESLKTEYFEQNVNKDTVLQAKLPIALPLLSLRHFPVNFTHFKCPNHNYVTCRKGLTCDSPYYQHGHTYTCNKPMDEVTYIFVAPKSDNNIPGFVKEAVAYIVMDDLEVKPMSLTLIKSLMSDFDHLVEEEVQFSMKEGLALLKASLETNKVLTTVFLTSK